MADTVLVGCEVLCLTGDLIGCPLPLEQQEKCMGRLQYHAGIKAAVDFIYKEWDGTREHRAAKLKDWGLYHV